MCTYTWVHDSFCSYMYMFSVPPQPSWTLYIQVMTFEEAEKFRWDPFDLTKVRA